MWLPLVMRWAWLWCRQISARGLTVVCPGGLGIGYKCRAVAGSSSLDTAPVTGSLLFNAPVCRITVDCAAGLPCCALISCSDCIRLAVCRVFLQRISVDFVMATDVDAPAEARSGITFGVTLEVPWNAPQAYVQLDSVGVVDLDTVPDVLCLTGQRPEVAVVRVLQGRDERSVRVLITDPRVLDSGFHDVTIVDMEDSAEPAVSEDHLSLLRLQWPVTVLRSMVWLQSELDAMHAVAKRRFRNSRPADCSYCGKWIKCDMCRHVSMFHLDLGQLWRCPVSWCTVWKGTPQQSMDHVLGAHNVPSDIKSTSLDIFFPPWTVQRQIWADALKPCHSGVSTDVLLFSETQLALVYHYQVFRRGLPHHAFCRDYLSRLRVFISQASALAQCGLISPVPTSSPWNVRPCDTETESPRKTRRRPT